MDELIFTCLAHIVSSTCDAVVNGTGLVGQVIHFICPLNCYRRNFISSRRRMSLDSDARKIYSAAIEAVSPSNLIPRALEFDPDRGLLSVAGTSMH